MFADFIMTHDQRWSQILESCAHDVYHLPAYIEFAAWHEKGVPTAFYAEQEGARFLVPLLLRDVPAELGAPLGWQDAMTPYGYPGPILCPSDDGPILRRFLEAFTQRCEAQNIVTAFIRLHPLLEMPTDVLQDYGEVVSHGQTVTVDLSPTLEMIRAQFRQNHRRDIRKLAEAGFQVRRDCWDYYDDFIRVYRETMERLGATEFYFFTDAYFSKLRAALGSHLHLFMVFSSDGSVASAALFMSINQYVQYHLGATDERFLANAPSKLLFDDAIRWAKDEGYRTLHLGGGVGAKEDSLFRFKAGFSSARCTFNTYRMVFSEQKYALLNDRWYERYKSAEDSPDFFPRYRASHS
jgi:hypothetical protein